MGSNGQTQQPTDEKLVKAYQEAKKQGNAERALKAENEFRKRFGQLVTVNFESLSTYYELENNPIIVNSAKKKTLEIIKLEAETILNTFSSLNRSGKLESHLYRTVSNAIDISFIRIYKDAKASKDNATAEQAWGVLWSKYNREETNKCVYYILTGGDDGLLSDPSFEHFVGQVSEGVWEIMTRKWQCGTIIPDSFDTERVFFPYWRETVRHAICSVIKKMRKTSLVRNIHQMPTGYVSNSNTVSDPYTTVAQSEEELETIKLKVAKRLPFYAKYLLAKAKLEEGIYNLTKKEVRCLRTMVVYKLKNGIYELTRTDVKALAIWAYHNCDAKKIETILEVAREIINDYHLDEVGVRELPRWLYNSAAVEEIRTKWKESRRHSNLSEEEDKQLKRWLASVTYEKMRDQVNAIKSNSLTKELKKIVELEYARRLKLIVELVYARRPKVLKALISWADFNTIIERIKTRLEEIALIAGARYTYDKKKIGMTSLEIMYVLLGEISDQIIRKRWKDNIDQIFHRLKNKIDGIIEELWDL